jgi:hypothetical protein
MPSPAESNTEALAGVVMDALASEDNSTGRVAAANLAAVARALSA